MIYIDTKSNDPKFNTAVEFYAFNELAKKDDVFILWINKPCIVVGKNQNTTEEINQKYCDEKGIEIVRRVSGGGAVYHDLNNLNYTIISNGRSGEAFDFKSFSQPVIDALATLGVSASFTGRNDLEIDGRKFCGNAQYVRNGRIMHHGCLMFDVDTSVLSEALKVSKDKIESKGIKSVSSRVTNIKEYVPNEEMTVQDFKESLRLHMEEKFGMTSYVLSEEELTEIKKIQTEKNDSWDWVYGKNPEFNIKRNRRLSTGKIEANIQVDNGHITNVKFFGDFFGVMDVEDISKKLEGVRYSKKDISEVLEKEDINSYFLGAKLEEVVDIIVD
ncbi:MULTISPECIES: lipoate--protein ligase [unclassified Gemella]|uniref:lipoate--protein ligase n=1 Tax=unclassified Gemella TaxID=2624949 RepID=UPI001C04D1B9|nr:MULTISPECIES: lipoate--protein ligase [unclassified Gemella]MBU0278266.1 lipoate--protein ligase [Gemella sp. zg-1178]QWQ38227.1 lipoate--protein ligase [Gemella sp. zg-570]